MKNGLVSSNLSPPNMQLMQRDRLLCSCCSACLCSNCTLAGLTSSSTRSPTYSPLPVRRPSEYVSSHSSRSLPLPGSDREREREREREGEGEGGRGWRLKNAPSCREAHGPLPAARPGRLAMLMVETKCGLNHTLQHGTTVRPVTSGVPLTLLARFERRRLGSKFPTVWPPAITRSDLDVLPQTLSAIMTASQVPTTQKLAR